MAPDLSAKPNKKYSSSCDVQLYEWQTHPLSLPGGEKLDTADVRIPLLGAGLFSSPQLSPKGKESPPLLRRGIGGEVTELNGDLSPGRGKVG